MIESDRIISAQSKLAEERIDYAIRPSTLREYVGQSAVKEQMEIFIHAARGRSEALDHTLIFLPFTCFAA